MSLQFISKCRAGESAYYAPRPRGTVQVEHDGKKWLYRKPASLRDFKNELQNAFETDGRCCAKVTGAYPYYSIDTY